MLRKQPNINYISEPICVLKVSAAAEIPYKDPSRESDVGYDITLIARKEEKTEDETFGVTLFDTGLKVKPPAGYYIELVARSSLFKDGYMLANSVGIIDPSYRGNLLVPLFKFRECQDITLPYRGVQMILRPLIYSYVAQVKSLDTTERGEEGFGSTGHFAPSNLAPMERKSNTVSKQSYMF